MHATKTMRPIRLVLCGRLHGVLFFGICIVRVFWILIGIELSAIWGGNM